MNLVFKNYSLGQIFQMLESGKVLEGRETADDEIFAIRLDIENKIVDPDHPGNVNYTLDFLRKCNWRKRKERVFDTIITKSEKEYLLFLEKEENIFWLARNCNGRLRLFFKEPYKDQETKCWRPAMYGWQIDEDAEPMFKFITWDSGKAWSNKELSELKVIDQKGRNKHDSI